MTLYTRTGDQGETDVEQGVRGPKDSPRMEVCGALDELNSHLGLVRSEPLPDAIDGLLARIQRELFELGADLTHPRPEGSEVLIGSAHVERIEADIDRLDATLAPLSSFILPGGTRAAAGLHVARSVCRRVERRLVGLSQDPAVPAFRSGMAYLNRLGDLLFVLARGVNQQAGRSDTVWRRG